MIGFTGRLGRSPLGKFELARGVERRVGDAIEGTFQCDGVGEASWLTNHLSVNDRFQCDGFASVSFDTTGGIGVAGFFQCDGRATVLFLSGSGSAKIDCLVGGETSPGPISSDSLVAIRDNPSAY